MSNRPGALRRACLATILMVLIAASPTFASDYETRLIDIAQRIEKGHIDLALAGARALVRQYPGSRLGRLMYADLLTSQAAVLDAVGAGGASGGRGLRDLRQELHARWQHINVDQALFEAHLPDSLLQVAPHSEYVVFVDLAQSRLFVFANERGRLRRVNDFYVTQGLNGAGKQLEGDQRTPVGVYYITGYIDGATLPSRYGPGALPISYPNAMDLRRQRTGHGIWIHGTEPFLVNRAPQASDGCLSLNNDDFRVLNRTIDQPHHTPVIIDPSPRWVSSDALRQRREALLLAIEAWRRDWQSGEAQALLSHYDRERFSDGEEGFAQWSARKQAVLADMTNIEVIVDHIELFGYPGEQDVVLADFEQHFDSDTLTSSMRKQQYWQRGDDRKWRIIFEGVSHKSLPRVVVDEPSTADPNNEPFSS